MAAATADAAPEASRLGAKRRMAASMGEIEARVTTRTPGRRAAARVARDSSDTRTDMSQFRWRFHGRDEIGYGAPTRRRASSAGRQCGGNDERERTRKHGVRRGDRRRGPGRPGRGDPAEAGQPRAFRRRAREGRGGRRAYPVGRGGRPDRHRPAAARLARRGRSSVQDAGHRRPFPGARAVELVPPARTS